MTVKAMLEAHPEPQDIDRDAFIRCIEACFDCSQACTSCADACLSEEAIAELRKCIRLNLDCADICDVTGRMLTRQTGSDAPLSKSQLETCRQACRTCAEECERHSDKHEHCRVCAERCRECETACKNLLDSAK